METNAQKRYQERLTSNNAALLLIDHQVGLFTGVRDIPVAELFDMLAHLTPTP